MYYIMYALVNVPYNNEHLQSLVLLLEIKSYKLHQLHFLFTILHWGLYNTNVLLPFIQPAVYSNRIKTDKIFVRKHCGQLGVLCIIILMYELIERVVTVPGRWACLIVSSSIIDSLCTSIISYLPRCIYIPSAPFRLLSAAWRRYITQRLWCHHTA